MSTSTGNISPKVLQVMHVNSCPHRYIKKAVYFIVLAMKGKGGRGGSLKKEGGGAGVWGLLNFLLQKEDACQGGGLNRRFRVTGKWPHVGFVMFWLRGGKCIQTCRRLTAEIAARSHSIRIKKQKHTRR